MRVLFISANTEQINMPALPLGLSCVAAATRGAGHDVEVVDLMFQEDTRSTVNKAVERFGPQVVGISVRNIDDQSMDHTAFLLERVKEVVDECRSCSQALLVLGGAGYSIFPERALSYLGADMGIQGEGEQAFPALLERLDSREPKLDVPGLYVSGRGLQAPRLFRQDLDALPDGYQELRPSQALKPEDCWVPVQSRRGCPLACSYCTTPKIEGSRIRKRSPEAVVRALTQMAAAGYTRFFFVDNTFNLPPSYAKEICSLIQASGQKMTWRAILYPFQVDEDLVRRMARAGCAEVSLGFESGSLAVLRAMNKRFVPEQVKSISRLLGDYGIGRRGFLLLGGPGETRGSVEESLEFADRLGLESMKVTSGLRIYPDTALAGMAVDRGMVDPDDDLLLPRSYLERGLEDWLPETLNQWMADRPHWQR